MSTISLRGAAQVLLPPEAGLPYLRRAGDVRLEPGSVTVSGDVLAVQQGSLYPALHRMERRGWLASEWGASESNRRAKFYRLTPAGRSALREQESAWRRLSEAVGRVLGSASPKGA